MERRSITLPRKMTFKQIEKTGKMYSNHYGIVFTPFRELGKMIVSYNIDHDDSLQITKSSEDLALMFNTPAKVDYRILYSSVRHQLQI